MMQSSCAQETSQALNHWKTPSEIAVKENEDALKEIKDSGKSDMHYLTPEQKKAWQVAMQPTWQWAEGRVGKEVIGIMPKATSS